MKNKSIAWLVVILAIVVLASFIAVKGLQIGDFNIPSAKDSIDLGLDLAGGIYVVLEAQTDAQGEELNDLMNQTKLIMEQRVNGLGISEPNISIENNNRIRIELAGIQDPQEAIELIGKTAQLQFIEPNANIVLTGKNVKKADVMYQKNELGIDEPVVSLEFDKEGAERFKEATGRLIYNDNQQDRIIYIVLDDQVISYPSVGHVSEGAVAISDGKAIISGKFDLEYAKNLSNLINAGALPVEMKEHQTSLIGPTLGLQAFEKSIKAGMIAILLIFIFMIAMYKLLGVVACISLIAYTIIVIYTMSIIGVKLTLPGIAGLILSIGMAVDANVLIFERIREELKSGKTVRSSISFGFDKALSSVLDSNITTLIAGIVLYYFGIGPIKGFGVTLIIGILTSMLTSVVLSKVILKLIGNITTNEKAFGA